MSPGVALLIDAVICLLGLTLHVLMKWGEYRQTGPYSIADYVRSAPVQFSIAVIAAIATWLVMWRLDWLNSGMAFACGYVGHSVAENLANRFQVLK